MPYLELIKKYISDPTNPNSLLTSEIGSILIDKDIVWAAGEYRGLTVIDSKKKKFTRFAKSKLSTTKDGKIEVYILKGQESFRIKSFVKSNIWALLPAGKYNFKN